MYKANILAPMDNVGLSAINGTPQVFYISRKTHL